MKGEEALAVEEALGELERVASPGEVARRWSLIPKRTTMRKRKTVRLQPPFPSGPQRDHFAVNLLFLLELVGSGSPFLLEPQELVLFRRTVLFDLC